MSYIFFWKKNDCIILHRSIIVCNIFIWTIPLEGPVDVTLIMEFFAALSRSGCVSRWSHESVLALVLAICALVPITLRCYKGTLSFALVLPRRNSFARGESAVFLITFQIKRQAATTRCFWTEASATPLLALQFIAADASY